MSLGIMFIEEAKLKADLHLQVEVDQDADASYVDFRALGYTRLTIRSRVRRIFKGTDAVELNDRITFSMHIAEPPFFSVKKLRMRDFDIGHFNEVYLNVEPPKVQVVLGCLYNIDELTDEPTAPVDLTLAREAQAYRNRVPLALARGGRIHRFVDPAANDD